MHTFSSISPATAIFLAYKYDSKADNCNHFTEFMTIGGKRVGIVGLRNIGLEVAKRLEAFGCNIYNSRKAKSYVSYPFYFDILAGNFEAFFSNKPLLSPAMDD
ncbi:hypothetical protein L3X38_044683 [Prunus dulcis]|uniref:D-isomer specific 2-hydroxyacid dehydrogenase NAD-binding domain-containing protein n=1 Tax=Prunus dulcis TaxID=3755 RepID=A0AAD4V0T6_PRUDU|nr:hypothetical protein L3X38_044683 [Prunus dulcis]